jgi:hypothetical protein
MRWVAPKLMGITEDLKGDGGIADGVLRCRWVMVLLVERLFWHQHFAVEEASRKRSKHQKLV